MTELKTANNHVVSIERSQLEYDIIELNLTHGDGQFATITIDLNDNDIEISSYAHCTESDESIHGRPLTVTKIGKDEFANFAKEN